MISERLFPGMPNFNRLFYVLFAAWIVALIALPIAAGAIGARVLPWGVMVGVILQAATVLLILYQTWRAVRTAWTAAVVMLSAWGIEAIGSSTGFPFGAYAYTDQLQPQIAHVPLLIPLAWFMMLPPSWAVACRITGSRHGLAFIGLSALAFTVWDLFLDPQMVAWGLWVWENPGGYFGIPWVNYAGWLLASALITVVARPQKLPIYPLLLIYTITWALETIGLLIFWGLPGPALAGFVGMGSLAGLAWFSRREKIS
jgi:uncharacterized membrane protein